MCFGGDKIADLFKDQLQQLPLEIQQKISKKGYSWKNISGKPSNRSMMDPSELLGEWIHEDEDATTWVTVGTDQTIMNFMQLYGMEPAEGSIGISGSAVDSMAYMMLTSFYGYTILIISNNPIDYGYYYNYEEVDIELPFYTMTFSSFGTYSFAEFIGAEIVNGDTVFYDFENEDVGSSLSIDTTLIRVDITALEFSNDTGDTIITLNGSLAPGTIDLVADTPFEIPFLSDDFGPDPGEDESMYFQFYGDGTGFEIYSGFDDYYGYEWTDTSEFEWSATDDSLTLIFSDYDDYYGYEYSDTISLAYSIMYLDSGAYLNISAEFDFCEMMGDDYYYYYDSLDCFDMLEEYFGMTDIQDVSIDFWMEMRYIGPLAIGGEIGLHPDEFKLHHAFPNPFNPTTTLQYEMGSTGPVSIDVFDVNGRKIRNLYSGIQIPGQHEIRWDAKDDRGRSMSSGVYLFNVNVNGKTQTAKTLLLK